MTRRIGSVVRTPPADKPAFLRPLRPSRNLTEEIVDRIASEIRSGRLEPGSKLPTEQKLMHAMRLSRTVVREAVAALRAAGLGTTRQGAAACGAAEARGRPHRAAPLVL